MVLLFITTLSSLRLTTHQWIPCRHIFEYPAYLIELERECKFIDIDADSALSREEMSIYFKKLHKSSNEDKRVEDFFSSEDKDKNGYISHEEFSGSKHDEL